MSRINRRFEQDAVLKEPNPREKDIKCPCCAVKTVAKERDGSVYVWCKGCKSEVEIKSRNY